MLKLPVLVVFLSLAIPVAGHAECGTLMAPPCAQADDSNSSGMDGAWLDRQAAQVLDEERQQNEERRAYDNGYVDGSHQDDGFPPQDGGR